MARHERQDWFEREEFIGQISDIRVQNLQVEREAVQKRTFTRWMNLHLQKCDPPIQIQDLFQDIQDGFILMVLLEELSGCKLVRLLDYCLTFYLLVY
uniref:Calponin-homology (CH) domain-containing protein n=1 Tax=Oryzias latipes TaxID=8090 RepID=A0A3P9JNM1_ORYLA